MGAAIDISVDLFWETSVGFLKNGQSYVNLNVKSTAKFNCL